MDDLLTKQIESIAKERTVYQVLISFLVVLYIVSTMSKHFKTIADFMPSVRKALKWMQDKVLRKAIFEADVRKGFENLQLQNNHTNKKIEGIEEIVADIKEEVKYNGGSRRMVDVVKVLEVQLYELTALRNISDKFDEKMNFRYDPKRGVIFISESFLDRFGCKESEVKFYAWIDLIHPEDRQEAQEKWKVAIETETSFSDTQRIRDGIGAYHDCMVKAEIISFKGEILQYKGVIEPIYK